MEISVASPQQMPHIYNLRWRVFVEEQQVPFLLELDARDTAPDTIHVAATHHGQVVGTARILDTATLADTANPLGPKTGTLHIGRVAVDKAWRGQGVGRKLMEGAHRIIQGKLGAEGSAAVAQVRLDAQVQAQDFYASLGYRVLDGHQFMDAGIAHVEMELVLSAENQ
ncbi:GNAT family N-acetyltransferase [Boudabousia marimammalium]|uniref:N-acetyltransferase domain-containing protein n=1 Tax=Boudabousia marimammalium TaxID=156892 RepID=A0A1Q5PSQ3_9ACTO|nr:GNAT family N-acetyltransferase [Boudabousia marimammalium]OKL50586.1 hypothetical protein BM477_01090 [Boudabousia marimammalium]